MAQRKITLRPAADERLVVPERGKGSTERVFLGELAQHLHHRIDVLQKFAKKHGMTHSQRLANGIVAQWVSPYAAMRIIAYVRAMQGDSYMQGKDFHEQREAWVRQWRKQMAKKELREK